MARKEYRRPWPTYKNRSREIPRNAVLLNKMGVAYQQLGDLNDAEHFTETMKADKNYASAVNNLGTVEYQRKRYGQRHPILQRGSQARRADHDLQQSRLRLFRQLEYPEAMARFGKALALDPDVFTKKGGVGAHCPAALHHRSGPLHFLLAKTYAEMGDAEHAAHYLKLSRMTDIKISALRKDPEFATVIKDPRVQEVLDKLPPLEAGQKPVSNRPSDKDGHPERSNASEGSLFSL